MVLSCHILAAHNVIKVSITSKPHVGVIIWFLSHRVCLIVRLLVNKVSWHHIGVNGSHSNWPLDGLFKRYSGEPTKAFHYWHYLYLSILLALCVGNLSGIKISQQKGQVMRTLFPYYDVIIYQGPAACNQSVFNGANLLVSRPSCPCHIPLSGYWLVPRETLGIYCIYDIIQWRIVHATGTPIHSYPFEDYVHDGTWRYSSMASIIPSLARLHVHLVLGRQFTDNIFTWIFFNVNFRSGDKQIPEPKMTLSYDPIWHHYAKMY